MIQTRVSPETRPHSFLSNCHYVNKMVKEMVKKKKKNMRDIQLSRHSVVLNIIYSSESVQLKDRLHLNFFSAIVNEKKSVCVSESGLCAGFLSVFLNENV